MRFFKYLVAILILVSCSTKSQPWDSGAQKQESIEDQTKHEQQDQIRDQSPSERDF